MDSTFEPQFSQATETRPVYFLSPELYAVWSQGAGEPHVAWAEAAGFTGLAGQIVALPGPDNGIEAVLAGMGDAKAVRRGRLLTGDAPNKLPPGDYRIAALPDGVDEAQAALAWLLGSYRYGRYKDARPARARLVAPEDIDADRVLAIATGACLAQDLINTPANDMGPDALQAAVEAVGNRFGADVSVIEGQALLDQNYPMIHAVGRAADSAPRLIDLTWGNARAPRVTLVGKGVCFDTGGLNLKPGSSMGLMKKDMGGAANALGLAAMIMALDLNIRLRLLIPAVENAVSSSSFRPGDVLRARDGQTVEINNTDAEGRLVLADALALAAEEEPNLLISLATLTGAARVALGPDLVPFFTDDAQLADDLAEASTRVEDPLWRMPFWDPYEEMIEPDIAGLDNAPKGGMAGAITAALFLRRFTPGATSYAHFDLYGWTPASKPGRPKGGACQSARALLEVIESRFRRFRA